ncbi:glycine betaine ABC transporter substrate-binding protein [Hahella ganghwensis]|uniref:ABC transporter substrate-binding protein n=1 Tax=Hahella ganghwensis TaxID=286420 RepID=UPI00037B39E8
MKVQHFCLSASLVLLTACGQEAEQPAQETNTTTAAKEQVADSSSCGRVTIADMNWNSATFMAHLDKFILSQGYGCDAELMPGDTMPTGTSMIEKGEPDIAPEMWSNSLKDAIDRGVEEKRLRYAGKSLSDGGEEGFWVPQYMVEEDPSLAKIEGVIAKADIFKHPEDPDKSMFMGCPAGWNCQITSGNLFRALNLSDAGFELVDPGSGAALAGAIAKAYENKEPWFGYYWAPTAVLGKYKMVKVDFGTGADPEEYISCTSKEGCVDPKVTMYPPSPVHTVTTENFASEAPQAYEYLTKRSFTNEKMNEFLAWMEQNQADGSYAAEYFIKNHENTWSQWVSAEAATSIKEAIANL